MKPTTRESYHTQKEACLPDGPLRRVERDALILHWFIAGIGIGALLVALALECVPVMVP